MLEGASMVIKNLDGDIVSITDSSRDDASSEDSE